MLSEPWQYVVEALNEMQREVKQLQGLFTLNISGEHFELPVKNCDWQPVPGIRGLEIAALPVADWPANPLPDADYFLTRGPAGIEQAAASVPQAVVLEVLEGCLCFWKESAPAAVLYQVGDLFTLVPNEEHGWRAITAFRTRACFSPRITRA